MPLYEHVFLARQDASAQQVEELTTQMTGIVEGLGGKVVKTENWGVRSLTYRMNKNRKAHFVLLNIDAPSAAVAEVERQERISEDVHPLSHRSRRRARGRPLGDDAQGRSRPRSRRPWRSASVATAKAVSAAVIVTAVVTVAIVVRAVRVTTPKQRLRSKNHG